MFKRILLLFIVSIITIVAGAQSYNMSNTTINTCGGTFYDPGGTGNYASSQALMTMTICSNNGGPVSLNFTGNPFQVETSFDFLVIYDGPTATGPGLYNSQTAGGTTNPGIITSSGTCLTITWSTDGSVVYSGWQAAIQCPSCTNGIQDGAETGVDCGGPTCPACPNCFNGIQDGTETGIDCGPSCPNPCHCSDGVLSGNETGVDCGGSCGPCPIPCDVQLTYSTPLYDPPPVAGPAYTMSSGTVSTCGGTFYDPGGSGGSYGNNNLNTQTFCSSTPGGQLQFVFTQWALETCCDYLIIYDGPTASGTQLFNGNGSTNPGTVTSSNGCLTFVWDSDGSVVGAGWTATINCVDVPQPLDCNGGNIVLTAVGQGEYTLVMNNNFDAGSAGTGWNSNVTASFTNPCDPSIDGGTYMWMGNSSPHPRIIETMPLDVSCGGEICFFLDFATQGNASPCEGIDEPDEGVFFEYSINGGATWITMEYYGPAGVGNSTASGGTNPQMTAWNQYCLPIPPGAESPATLFHWAQTGSSGNANDHWGIDNVTISSLVNCTPYWYDYSYLPPSSDNPIQNTTVTGTTTYNVTYTNGVDACNASLTVTLPPGTTANAGPDQTKCFGGPAVTIGANPVTTDNTATYSWNNAAGSGTIDLVAPGITNGQVSVSPATTTSYILSVTYNGCTDTDTVRVVVDMPPTASNPAPLSVACTSDIPPPNVAVVTTEADDITIPPTVTWISDVSNGGTCPNIVTRTYRVTDACGNFVNVTQTITAGATSTVTMPANGGSTVACPAATNTAPTPPTVTDQCGRTLTVSAPVISALPTCSGTRTYTYTYTSCTGGTYPWVYTYTISAPTVTMPANGASTVACPSAATAPTPPTVLDNCGRTLTVSAPVISPDPACAGTKTYTYTYTSCSGTTYPWVYTYTISAPTVVMPANGASTVACPTAATAPTAPTVLDNCGRTLTVSAPVISPDPACAGTKTYTYTYTSCSGTTYPWVYTYTISAPTVVMPANGASTVACPSAATAPTPPTVLDNCGRTLTVSAPVISAAPACSGTQTYTYTYTSCSGTTYPWVYTYTISAPTVVMPANGASTIACPSAATAPTPPTVLDNCGRTLTVSAPVISAAPACSGTQTYTYTYTSCTGTTYPWVYTYTISAPTVVMPANGASTVACPTAATAPTPPTVLDNCGRTLTVSAPVISAAPACSGTQTYTYTYTSCSGTTYPWVYTYTISAPTVVMPANGSSIVACIALMTAPTAPTVLDNCGRTLTVSAPVISPDPACGGTKTYTYTYTSCSGTTYSWVYTYTYNDNIAPTASNPAPISVAGGVAPAPDPLVVIDEADNCTTPTVLWVSDVSDNGVCPETITRTYSVTDACGNQILVTQIITIGDAILPTASNPAPVAVDCIANVPTQNPLVVIDEADNGTTPIVTWEDDTSDGLTCPQTITRRYRVTDDCGNFIFVTQTISVDDNIAPVFAAAPANITVACTADVPVMTNLSWTDNCAGSGAVAGTDGALVGGTCGGTITRTWIYTDPCGNTATATQTITVDDNIAPVFAAAPAAVTVACSADVPAMTNLVYTDNCDAAGSVAGTDVSNGGTCPEIITRTWTITDACGNTTSTTQTITVHDLVAPVFAAAPAAVTVECLADVPAMTNLAYTDNCDVAGTVAGTDGALVGGACGGTITRTWTITDACGNTTTTTQTITVDDNTNPTASNPATTTVPGGPAPAVDPLVVIDEADNCSVPVVAFVSESTDGAACPETITRIYSVTDACGNTINVTHTILITDPFPPTASNPAPIAVECIGDVPAPDVTVVTDEADNQGTPTVAFVSDVSNGMTCPEIITRTYSVTDLCGGQIFVTQTITVEDITAPVFAAAPAAVTVACSADVPAMTNLAYTDNCDPAGTVAGTDVSNGGTCPEIITRTWTFTDACGNTSSTTQTITVHDLVAPVFAAAPAAVTVACSADVPAMTNLAYTDNCDAAGSVAGTDVSNGGTCPEIITRTWTITDACGNTTSTTQTITVHDLVAPVFAAAPAAVTVECLADVPAMTNLAYTDNCDVAGTVAGTDGALVGGACGGTITRTWTITDACGNTTTTTQTITVDDNTNPTASNPATTTVPGGPAPAVDPLVVIDETDNCSVPVVAFVSESTDGAACPETITRIYSVTDACGNTINVTHTILITDPFPPTASNPAPIAVECIGDVPAPDVTVVTDEADNQGTPTVAFVSDVSNGMTCPEIITRTYSVTDLCGGQIFVTQTITVEDITAPVFAAAPAAVTVACSADVPAMTNLGYTDNCDPAGSVAGTDVSNGGTCPEIITRTWTFTDACGNTSSTTQTITVHDLVAPVFAAAPAAVTVACSADVPAMTNLAYTDNCDAAGSVAGTDVSNGGTCPEIITRTWTITDACGNTTSTTQTITVHDLVAPVFAAAPAAVTVECLADVPAMTNLAYTDNCDVAGTVTGTDGALVGGACGGTITRTWTITDACGNTTTTTQTITVDDNTNPTASNPATTTVPGGPAPAVDPLVVIDEADNCSVPVVAFVSESTDGAACPETITRVYSVTDACGNTINVTHTILITDPFPPTASNPAPIAVECIGDVPAPDVTVVTDEADNQGTPTVAFVSDVSNGMTCPEIITRTYSVTDVCNNMITVTQTITVDDITAPTATAPATVNVECIGDVPAANIALITDEADNCTVAPIVAHVGDVSDGLSCPETITRTYSITDNCGNVTTVAQTIIVDDVTAPTGTAPSTVNVECIGDVPAANIALITNEADNCTAAPIVAHVGDVSDGLSCPETITRTYSITDNCGNVTTVTQSIIVNDVTNPTASNPVSVAVQLPSQVPAPDVTVVTNEADNCTAAPVVTWVSDVSDGLSCPETITRTYSVTDNCNNSITVVQIITVSDLTAPTASNPVAVNVECIGDVPAFDVTVVTNEADNSGIAPTVAFVGDVSDGLSCPETITRTYSVTDNCNNSILVTQTIVVNDVTAPTATAPATVNVECIGDVPAPNTALITDEVDNCTVTPVVTFVSDVSDGNTCPETITRTYRITDDCNNTTNVTQTIIVNDITAPTASAPAAVTVECIGDVPVPNVSIITNEADNCTAAPIVAHVGDVSDGNTCPETITRTYSITDDCGNVTTVAQTIIVNDITAPTASNPVAISVPGSMDVPAPDVTVVTTEADNCTANPVVAWVSDVSDGNVCNLEEITRTYSITDDCGNQTLVTQLITILAVYPPIDAGPDQSICLGDATSVNAINPMGVPITWDMGVNDGVQFEPTATATYTVTADNLGCISTDQMSIEVKPLPVVSFMPDTTSGCIPLLVTFTNTTPNSVSAVWTISDGSQLTGIGTVSNVFDQPGCYDVTLTTTVTNGCTNTFTASNLICVEAPPIAAFSPSSNTLSTINTEVSFNNNTTGAIDYEWNFGDGSPLTDEEEPSHIYSEESGQNYLVTLVATSPLGCVDTAYSTIQVIEELIYYVPNTFTPDGDAFNNTFKPIFTSGFDPYDYTLLIFDRWGEIIFESHNSEVGWDGTYNGGLVQDGTYTWKLEFKSNQNDKRMIDIGHVNMLK